MENPIKPRLYPLHMEKQQRAYLFALATVLFWATVASAFKLTLKEIDYFQLVLYSVGVSALVLFVLIAVQNKFTLLRKCTQEEMRRSAILGFLNPFLYYLVLFKAYSLLLAQEAQPLNQTWGIIVPLMSIVLLKQKIGAKSILALFISFFGVLIISTQGDLLGLHFTNTFGVALALGSAFIWSFFWIYNVDDERDEVVKLFLNFLFGFIFIFILMVMLGKLAYINSSGLLGAVYIGLFEMGITFVLWLKALQLSATTAQVSNMIYLVPFLSLVVIHYSLGEEIMYTTMVGLAFIVVGIILQRYWTRKLKD